jgi:hypothetical protein
MLAAFALTTSLSAASTCNAPPAGLTVYLEADAVRQRDSVAHVRLCIGGIAGATRDMRVGSLSARVVVDTAFGRIADVERTRSPDIYARADTLAGTVLVAGASNGGIGRGALVTIRVRLLRAGTLPKMSVVLTELNEPTGTSLVTRTTVAGLDLKCAGTAPALLEVLPPAASADPGDVLDLRINGCGFSQARNTVAFGDVTVRNIKSAEGGTHIRVVIPKEIRNGAGPPMQLGAGEYDVTVNNGRGTSNAKRVTLR